MSRPVRLLGSVASGLVLLVLVAGAAWALPEYARTTKVACFVCHTNAAGGPDLTDAGKAFKEGKVPAAGTAKSAAYVGVNKCRTCHLKQYKAWSTTPHATALAALKNATKEQIADMSAKTKAEVKGTPTATVGCVRCHVTGLELAGGYAIGGEEAKVATVANVTCEACHGPGGNHVTAPAAEKKKMINMAPGEGLCKGCHTAEISPKFDYATMSKKVHPVAGS